MKVKLKDLIELAEKIKDTELREKTIELLKNPKISNKSMNFKPSRLEKIPSWAIGAHHAYEGGLIEHVYSVTKLSIKLAEHFKKQYKKEINMDYLIAGALLHDLAKVFQINEDKTFSDFLLEHNVWMAAELYSRGFPQEVIHIVVAHSGETQPPSPKTLEAIILYYADTIDSIVEPLGKEQQKVYFLGDILGSEPGSQRD